MAEGVPHMQRARLVLIAALGFFALTAQTLLFRDFLTVFEGNELGVSAFFTSWLLWIVAGAMAARGGSRTHRALTNGFPCATLLYVPAFILQQALILQSRAVVGVQAYEVFPFGPMFAMSMLANAPVSFLTGFLFALACRWAEDVCALPVARVYVLETFGSCLGAVACTLLLAFGVSNETAFICSACVLAGAAAMSIKKLPVAVALFVAALAVCVSTPILGNLWARNHAVAAWARLLPAQEYRGCFTTAQARYLYGEWQGQFVVMTGGGVCEALPAADHDAELAALHLAQQPAARTVLVFGEASLGLCQKFKTVPQIETVTWLHPDSEYPHKIVNIGAVRQFLAETPIDLPNTDLRTFARSTGRRYDLVILNLPDITTLVRNRYCTTEFLDLVKNCLRPGGVVSIRLSGGANYMGGELSFLGASVLKTLESAFARTEMKPGDETWLFATDGGGLSQSPGTLRDRYAQVHAANALYPAEGIFALYPPDRVAFQMQAYRQAAESAPALLLNTDANPKALLFGLLLALRQAGAGSYVPDAIVFSSMGFQTLAGILALFALVYLVFLWKSPRDPRAPAVHVRYMLFSTGFAGMAANIAFLFLHQMRYGSLFLDIGLLTALFMFGSALGGRFSERALQPVSGTDTDSALRRAHRLLALCLGTQLVLLALAASCAGANPQRLGWAARLVDAAPFMFCGMFTGVYFPVAARLMALTGHGTGASGSRLEALDNLGGAAGSLIAGLVMLPILGTAPSLALLGIAVAVNFVPHLVRGGAVRTPHDRFARMARPVGYAMFAVAVACLLSSQWWAKGLAEREGSRLRTTALEMTAGTASGEERVLTERSVQTRTGKAGVFYEVGKADAEPEGYIFATEDWIPDIYGYGGPINLAVRVDQSGVLRDFRVLRSKETPAYLHMLRDWQRRLPGRPLFIPDPFKGVDAVSGATISSTAIIRILEAAGRAFAVQALGRAIDESGTPSPAAYRGQWRDLACIAALMLAALAMRFRPRVWMRRLLLATTFVLAGLALNLQYSLQQVLSLASLNAGQLSFSATSFLLVGVPLIAVLFGNVYCGCVCPFGALQELAGDLWPHLNRDPQKRLWRHARAVKYVLLFAAVIAYALTRDYAVLQADPLIALFGKGRDPAVLALGGACVIASVFFHRFWCRNLCPAGAFLSLLNGVRLFRKWMPRTHPHRCDMGVQTAGDLDCLYCDRCNLPSARQVTGQEAPLAGARLEEKHAQAFLAVIVVLAGLFLAQTAYRVGAIRAAAAAETRGANGSAGKTRVVDLNQIRQLIDQKRLSSHEAQFYKQAPEPGTEAVTPNSPAGTP